MPLIRVEVLISVKPSATGLGRVAIPGNVIDIAEDKVEALLAAGYVKVIGATPDAPKAPEAPAERKGPKPLAPKLK